MSKEYDRDRIDTSVEKKYHNLNNHTLSGYLGKNFRFAETRTGKSVLTFSIWQLVPGKERAERHYYDCKAYGMTAEQIRDQQYGSRGIMVVGNGSVESWDDKNGKSHSKYVLVVNRFYWAIDCSHSDQNASCMKEDEDSESGRPKQRYPGQQASQAPLPKSTPGSNDFNDDDDIPF